MNVYEALSVISTVLAAVSLVLHLFPPNSPEGKAAAELDAVVPAVAKAAGAVKPQ